MYKLAGHTRAALMGVLFAMVGFSYALATSFAPDVNSGPAVNSRGLVGSLRFTNPLVTGSTDRDLGDAVAGSAYTTRYATATGGIPPYAFSSSNLASLTKSLSVLTSGAVVLAGTTTFPALPSPFRFGITVKDSGTNGGTSVTNQFRITVVTSTQFRFAISSLPDGSLGHPYTANLATINGVQPLKGFTASSITLGGAATTLEAVGLSLSAADGTIFGKPFKAGVLTFTAGATDKNGTAAASRSGTSVGQTFTINLVDDASVTGQAVTTGCTIKVNNTTTAGKDSISYKAFVELGNAALSSFSGQTLTLKIEGYTTPVVTFDSKGHAATAKGVKPTVKATLTTKGALSVTVGSAGFGAAKLITNTIATKAVNLVIGSAINNSEFLNFASKTQGSGFSLTYKTDGVSDLGGAFALTSVVGKDVKNASPASDTYQVKFIANPLSGRSVTSASSAVVQIGADLLTPATVAAKGSGISGGSKGAQISKISISTKGAGQLTTSALTTTATGLKTAATLGTGQSQSFGMTLALNNGTTSVFGGTNAVAVFAKGTSMTNTNPNK